MKLWKFRLHTGKYHHFVTNQDLTCKQAADIFMDWYSKTFDVSYDQTVTYEVNNNELHVLYTYKDSWINHYWIKFYSEDFEFGRVY